MKYLLIIIFILFVIIFIPVPIKILFHYKSPNNSFSLSIYIFKFNLTKKINTISKYKQEHNKPNYDMTLLLSKLINSRFKPSFYSYSTLSFCLDDSCLTSVSYGFFSNLLPILFLLLKSIFKVKKFSNTLKPVFINKFFINFKYSGIIFISIVQIINIIFIVKNCRNINYKN